MANWKEFDGIKWNADDLKASKNAVYMLYEEGYGDATLLFLGEQGYFGNLDVYDVLCELIQYYDEWVNED